MIDSNNNDTTLSESEYEALILLETYYKELLEAISKGD
jgi:hypothetical protein